MTSGTPVDTADEPHVFPRSVRALHTELLHGKFTYDVSFGPASNETDRTKGDEFAAVSDDRLTLLYGRNGTGKTSLLRLMFHALSPSSARKHRDALRATRFREIKITLDDGSYVRYSRDSDEPGDFAAEIRLGADSAPITCEFRDDVAQGVVYNVDQLTLPIATTRGVSMTAAEWNELVQRQRFVYAGVTDKDRFLAALGDLDLNPIFLEDSRAITGDPLSESGSARAQALARARARSERERRGERDDERIDRRELDLEIALERVRAYLSQLAFAGTQAGSLRVDTVYVTVTDAIIEHSPKVGKPSKRLIPELQQKVSALNDRAERFQRYGLLPESPMLDLGEKLEAAEDRHGPLLTQVLTPHLDGFSQRMDELEPGLEAVASFVDTLNAFLYDKEVRFSTGRLGVTIVDTDTQQRLRPATLSSGEKQIVLLFSDVVALQDETRLFLIDEPELSLNSEWQRQLVPSLLNATRRTGMQFIAATHSIEIMARYRERRQRIPPADDDD